MVLPLPSKSMITGELALSPIGKPGGGFALPAKSKLRIKRSAFPQEVGLLSERSWLIEQMRNGASGVPLPPAKGRALVCAAQPSQVASSKMVTLAREGKAEGTATQVCAKSQELRGSEAVD